MREFTIRSIEAQEKAVEAARLGVPTPGRSPRPTDTVVDKDEF